MHHSRAAWWYAYLGKNWLQPEHYAPKHRWNLMLAQECMQHSSLRWKFPLVWVNSQAVLVCGCVLPSNVSGKWLSFSSFHILRGILMHNNACICHKSIENITTYINVYLVLLMVGEMKVNLRCSLSCFYDLHFKSL